MRTTIRGLILGGLVGLAGCSATGPSGATCPSDSKLDYGNFGKPFMEKYCLRCHSASVTGDARKDAPVGLDFDTLPNIRAASSKIDAEAAGGPSRVNTDMPDNDPTPSEAERKQLGEWLACGAK